MLSNEDEKAFILKFNHFPSSFYKYRKLDDFMLNDLAYNWIWVAEIASLNDPFECSLLIDDYLFFQSEKLQDAWKNAVKEAQENIQICSFCECNDSLLIWSHYADQHKGICIEYDFTDCDEIRPFIQPVFYTNKIFKIKSLNEFNVLNSLMASLFKSKEWEYEKEWRVTIPTRSLYKEKANQMKVPKPKAIYLGTRFNLNEDSKKKQILQIATKLEIPIIPMSIHDSEYKLVKGEKLK